MSALLQKLVEKLEDENDELRERVRQLEELCFGTTALMPAELELTGSESRLLAHLLAAPHATKDSLLAAIYSARPDDPPEIKIIDVFVCKVRKKIRPFGLDIQTVWGQGYLMPPASKAKLRTMMGESAAASSG